MFGFHVIVLVVEIPTEHVFLSFWHALHISVLGVLVAYSSLVVDRVL